MQTYFTLTSPVGFILARDTNRRVIEDRLARIIDEDGFPDATPYAIHCRFEGDGRWCAKGTPLSYLVLGVDSTGWFSLDDSKAYTTANPARRLDS